MENANAAKKDNSIQKKTPEENVPVVRISVRQMVEFLLREGDIDARIPQGRDTEAMLAGSRVHRKLQKEGGGSYSAEVRMVTDREYDTFTLRVEGRADGIIDGDPVTIDEIKGMYLDVDLLEEPIPVHLAQAKCYAAMYADARGGDTIRVQMTYVNLDKTSQIHRFSFAFDVDELLNWYDDLLDSYAIWARWQVEHRKSRDKSMKDMQFPFPYREGQRDLVAAVYHTIVKKEELFLMAPTGVGKTMATMFPAIFSMGTGLSERIFYMTAKNATLEAGAGAVRILKEKGLDIRAVRITAKEKICPEGMVQCTPDVCPRARGHYDRVNDALYGLICDHDLIGRDEILSAASAAKVCPFLLELDAAAWCDVILCDYNYVFDPTARLSRFMSGARSDTVFLIDEAHNLVERGREMYSASLTKENVLAAKRLARGHKRLENALEKLNDLLLKMRHEVEDDRYLVVQGMPGSAETDGKEEKRHILKGYFDRLTIAVLRAYEEMQNLYRESDDGALKEKLLDFYFELGSFMKCMEVLDENSVVYVENAETGSGREVKKTFVLHLFCVTPARFLTECIDMGRSAIFFSATMLPINYYKEMLSSRENPWAIYAKSPFSTKKRKLMIGADVSTRYKRRGTDMYRRIARYLAITAGAKRGNYIAFFPSYRMLRDVFAVYREEFDTPAVDWVVQSSAMGDVDREIFLENFYENLERSLIAFAVMGGVFSEGIDLIGDRLVGAIIVGTGLPSVSPRQDILREYYTKKGRDGFNYAYTYPGMNKVEQAAGRVIRTEADTGVILLLDDRFLDRNTQALFPREWADREVCTLQNVGSQLRAFWDTIDT
ncbi:MAG: ATP-dependent DNA helicase [Lachnospiraceae bacterium]|nr:ATP-dependent DNA helicase [Lachnospiraceae bacterium]